MADDREQGSPDSAAKEAVARARESLAALRAPEPDLDRAHQPGIADPRWPHETPESVADRDYDFFRGRVDPQKFLALVRADATVSTRDELASLLAELSKLAREQMERAPQRKAVPPQVQALLPDSWRVTVTVGFGPTLFLTKEGDDRFRLRHARPRWLKPMPRFLGDADEFEPAAHASDLIVQICSDHPYVNLAVARRLTRGSYPGRLAIRSIEQGFARADTRELLGFDDGVSNLRTWPDDTLSRLAFVHPEDGEPDWAVGGSYLVYRKIRENLPNWEARDPAQQEGMIGRRKWVNEPLSRAKDPSDPTLPVYPDPTDPRDGPLTAHVRKVQPRRAAEDFTGTKDLDRRFLRRPYPFFDGVDPSGDLVAGLHFLAYMRSLRDQFEWIVQQWQTNPDFPTKGAGVDALYASGVLRTISGGYYFCPPAARAGESLARGLLDWGFR